eukprot:5053481-Pyramimonas_sp.AAC.1
MIISGLALCNGPVAVALGCEPGCSNFEVARALNSRLASDADIASQKFLEFFKGFGQTFRLHRPELTAFPAGAAEERV